MERANSEWVVRKLYERVAHTSRPSATNLHAGGPDKLDVALASDQNWTTPYRGQGLDPGTPPHSLN